MASTNAAIYCRISRDRVGAGMGVDRQREDCVQLAERLGWTVVATHTDNDLSAYSGKPRPGYKALLEDMAAGRIGGVLTWHTDRLHRSPIELEHYIEVAERMGVQTQTARAGIVDLSTPAGRLTARHLGSIARYESEHRSERVSRKREEIAASGGFLGGARPFGYTADGMALEPDEAAAIVEGTRAVLRGRSLRSIAADWNARGLRTAKTGRPWATASVRDLLLRARNAGLLQYRGQVVGPAAWPALVSEDEWRGVVAILTDPGRRNTPGNTPRWLGSGLYRCGVCGGPMVVGTSGQVRQPSYLCRAPNKSGVKHVTRNAISLDEYVGMVLLETLKRPDLADLLHQPESGAADAPALRDELTAIVAQREAMARDQAAGRITYAQFSTMNDEATARQERLESQLARLTRTDPLAVAADADDPDEVWAAFDLEQRREVLRRLVVVTIEPAPHGMTPRGGLLDTNSIRFDWTYRFAR